MILWLCICANNKMCFFLETGSGKTTQVPQFILEHAEERGNAVRIVCTEPRRIAAVAMADRVSHERGEKAGQTVGFQIRLESRVSPKTLLTFCTNGVLLRSLMGGGGSAGGPDSPVFSRYAHLEGGVSALQLHPGGHHKRSKIWGWVKNH